MVGEPIHHTTLEWREWHQAYHFHPKYQLLKDRLLNNETHKNYINESSVTCDHRTGSVD